MRHQEPKLTWKQQMGLLYLLSSPSVEAAAVASGISHATIWRWLREPEFSRKYRELRRGAVQVATARLQQLTGKAADTLETVMDTATDKPASRVMAARAILALSLKSIEVEDLAERLAELERRVAAIRERPARVA